MEYIEYCDRYTLSTVTELTEAQIMQSVTFWYLGAMSEAKVAVLNMISLQIKMNILSFRGGLERLQVDYYMLINGISVFAFLIFAHEILLMLDHFNRSKKQRIGMDVTTISFVSKNIHAEEWW